MLHSASEIITKIQVMLDKAQKLQRMEIRREDGAPHHPRHKYLQDDIRALAADIVNDGQENG